MHYSHPVLIHSQVLKPLTLPTCMLRYQLSVSFHPAGTMLSCNQEIMEYMAQNLMQYMNPTLLLPQLRKHNLITEEDAGQLQKTIQPDHLVKIPWGSLN